MEMLKYALQALGVDPDVLLGQAAEIGAAFGRLDRKCQDILINQHTLMAHFGLEIPPPTEEQAALIAAESAKVVAASTMPADDRMNGHGQ
jgi:hypothetical protein